MNTKNVEALKVIEIPYGDIGWGLDVNNKEAGIQSDLQHSTEPRELNDYHCVEFIIRRMFLSQLMKFNMRRKTESACMKHCREAFPTRCTQG